MCLQKQQLNFYTGFVYLFHHIITGGFFFIFIHSFWIKNMAAIHNNAYTFELTIIIIKKIHDLVYSN